MYRQEQIKIELRKGFFDNKIYRSLHNICLGPVVDLVIDSVNRYRINSRVDAQERDDEIVEGVINRILYGR